MAENFFGITDIGRQSKNNEDAFIAERVLNDRYIMACVIDGVGGYEGGEVAADIARRSIIDYFKIPSGDPATMMKEALIAANQKILQEKQQNRQYESMACVVTLAIVDMAGKTLHFAHVGDTRLYLLRDSSLVKLTKDHSFVGFLEDSGRLSEEAAMKHPKRNEINKALGFDGPIGINTDYIEIGESPFLPGDTILLCSDGLSDLVNSREITSILTSNFSLAEKGQMLVDAANQKGGKDNITIVLVQNDARPLKQRATKPVAAVKKNESEESLPVSPTPKKDTTGPRRNKKTFQLLLLSIVCIALSVLLLRYLFTDKDEQQTPALSPAATEQTAVLNQLMDILNSPQSKMVIISDSIFKSPLLVNDTILITKDSLQIVGSGHTILKADTAYKGPAILLGPNCKYVLIDNITLQNFTIGIATPSNALHLKNVRFNNCQIPVVHQFLFPDSSSVSGSIADSSFGIDTSNKQPLKIK